MADSIWFLLNSRNWLPPLTRPKMPAQNLVPTDEESNEDAVIKYLNNGHLHKGLGVGGVTLPPPPTNFFELFPNRIMFQWDNIYFMHWAA